MSKKRNKNARAKVTKGIRHINRVQRDNEYIDNIPLEDFKDLMTYSEIVQDVAAQTKLSRMEDWLGEVEFKRNCLARYLKTNKEFMNDALISEIERVINEMDEEFRISAKEEMQFACDAGFVDVVLDDDPDE